MSTIRPAAVAGMFYPADPVQLRDQILSLLARSAVSGPAPKALIVPHAGYIYSGAVAANAFAQLRSAGDSIKRVVVVGPCHRVAVAGVATSSVDYFVTPLGRIRVDRAAIAKVAAMEQVREFDLTHQSEHSIEVQLPFLQQLLTDFSLVPLVVGEVSPQQVSDVIEALWGGDETLIVISSDLSHYHDYDSAQAIDNITCKVIESLDGEAIGADMACGRIPISALLRVAQRHDLQVKTLQLCNSGDTAGDRKRVVGYGAWSFAAKVRAREEAATC